MHQDPKCSAAWNTCLFGSKRWCFLPPTVTPEELRRATATPPVPAPVPVPVPVPQDKAAASEAAEVATGDSAGLDDAALDSSSAASEQENYRRLPPSYWWSEAYPRLRASGLPMLEVIQRPGETIYVPPFWW